MLGRKEDLIGAGPKWNLLYLKESLQPNRALLEAQYRFKPSTAKSMRTISAKTRSQDRTPKKHKSGPKTEEILDKSEGR